MLATQMSGTILVRDNAPWPVGLAIESEAFLPGWKALKNFDGYELGRKIEEANWNFFYLAGEIKVTVLGSNCSKTLRRAVKRVLAKQEKQFNALEIKIVSKRFLGVPFMNITAHSRHIQQGICLVAAKDALPGSRPLVTQKTPWRTDGNGALRERAQGDIRLKFQVPRNSLEI